MTHAKAVRRAAVALSLAAAAALGLTMAARAGAPTPAESVPPAAPTPAGAAPAGAAPAGAPAGTPAAAAGAPKDIWDQTPYPLYEQNERVDPFTRGKPKLPPVLPGTGAAALPGDVVAKVLGKSMRAYDDAEALLSSDRKERYALCLEACQKGIGDLRQTTSDIGKDDTLARFVEPARALMERFQRLEATAKRLKLRQDVEAEFAGLKISVDGIVWNEQSPSAAINGQVAGEGALLNLGVGGQDVQVHRIRRDAVVFLYKGVQISIRLDRGGL